MDNNVPGSNTISYLEVSNSMAWQSCRCLIYVPCTAAQTHRWPIPEPFWPDSNSFSLVSDIVGQVSITVTFFKIS